MFAERIVSSLFGQRITHELDTIVKTYTDQKKFNGAVLVARGNQVLLAKGYGMANLEHHVQNTARTVFRLGSLTKSFTAIAIMQLMEQGKIAVENALSTYIPDYPNGEHITLHHLLSNTSGIPDYLLLAGFRETMRIPTPLNTLIARFRELPLAFEAGIDFLYSNSNWLLLGCILEQITGKSYADVIRETIFEPVGMMHSGYDWTAPIIEYRAAGYTDTAEDWVNAEPTDSSTMHAAGGCTPRLKTCID